MLFQSACSYLLAVLVVVVVVVVGVGVTHFWCLSRPLAQKKRVLTFSTKEVGTKGMCAPCVMHRQLILPLTRCARFAQRHEPCAPRRSWESGERAVMDHGVAVQVQLAWKTSRSESSRGKNPRIEKLPGQFHL